MPDRPEPDNIGSVTHKNVAISKHYMFVECVSIYNNNDVFVFYIIKKFFRLTHKNIDYKNTHNLSF